MTSRTTRTDLTIPPRNTVQNANTIPRGEDDEPHRFLGLSPAQLAAGALAAVTSALAASYLGVAGTLIGAALGSIVSTVGAALYATSLERAGRLTTTRLRLVRAADGTRLADPSALPPDLDDRVDLIADAAAPHDGGALRAEPGPRRRLPGWKVMAAVAGVFFAIALGLISLTELALGHPVADSSGSGTTISRTITGNEGPGATTPTPTPSVSDPSTVPTPSGSASTDATPSADASPSQQPAASDSPAPQDSGQPVPSQAPTQNAVPSPAATQAPQDGAPATP